MDEFNPKAAEEASVAEFLAALVRCSAAAAEEYNRGEYSSTMNVLQQLCSDAPVVFEKIKKRWREAITQ